MLFGDNVPNSFHFRAFNQKIVRKWPSTEFILKLSALKSNFTLTLDYLNPALNNLAQGKRI